MSYNTFHCWNDDDWYVYFPATKQVVAQYRPGPKPVPLHGQAVCKGFEAGRLGLKNP